MSTESGPKAKSIEELFSIASEEVFNARMSERTGVEEQKHIYLDIINEQLNLLLQIAGEQLDVINEVRQEYTNSPHQHNDPKIWNLEEYDQKIAEKHAESTNRIRRIVIDRMTLTGVSPDTAVKIFDAYIRSRIGGVKNT